MFSKLAQFPISGLNIQTCMVMSMVICLYFFVTSKVTDFGKNHLNAVLSVSTYGMKLCNENDEDAEIKIKTIVMPCFENEIKLELALYYIKDIMDTKCSYCV